MSIVVKKVDFTVEEIAHDGRGDHLRFREHKEMSWGEVDGTPFGRGEIVDKVYRIFLVRDPRKPFTQKYYAVSMDQMELLEDIMAVSKGIREEQKRKEVDKEVERAVNVAVKDTTRHLKEYWENLSWWERLFYKA